MKKDGYVTNVIFRIWIFNNIAAISDTVAYILLLQNIRQWRQFYRVQQMDMIFLTTTTVIKH